MDLGLDIDKNIVNKNCLNMMRLTRIKQHLSNI